MATINGLCLKKLRTFTGHEGERCYQGDLYLGSDKIGFWSQDPRCGTDYLCMEKGYSEAKLQLAIKNHNKDKTVTRTAYDGKKYTFYYDAASLLYDWIKLHDAEKAFKNSLKNGYAGIIQIESDYEVITYTVDSRFLSTSNDTLKEILHEEWIRAKRSCRKGKEPMIYKYQSMDDFIIGEPIKKEEIIR